MTLYDFLEKGDEAFPRIVHIETTNVCNIKCIHCPQADPYNLIPGYKPQYIQMDVWKKVVDEVAEYGRVLRLTPDGEPMLMKEWVEQVNYALEKGVETFCFNTHGLFMEGDKMDVLLQETDTNIAVEFSLDALWKTSYDRIRVASDYNKVMKNIFVFLDEIKRKKRDNVKVFVSCVVQPELDDDEFTHFKKFWEPLVDKVITRRYVDTKGLTPFKPEVEIVRDKRWPCLVLFTRMVVTYDGRVRFCPDDWLKHSTIGDLKESSIQELWSGKVISTIRQKHLDGKFGESHPTCAKCTDWKVIEWGNDYTTALETVFS